MSEVHETGAYLKYEHKGNVNTTEMEDLKNQEDKQVMLKESESENSSKETQIEQGEEESKDHTKIHGNEQKHEITAVQKRGKIQELKAVEENENLPYRPTKIDMGDKEENSSSDSSDEEETRKKEDKRKLAEEEENKRKLAEEEEHIRKLAEEEEHKRKLAEEEEHKRKQEKKERKRKLAEEEELSRKHQQEEAHKSSENLDRFRSQKTVVALSFDEVSGENVKQTGAFEKKADSPKTMILTDLDSKCTNDVYTQEISITHPEHKSFPKDEHQNIEAQELSRKSSSDQSSSEEPKQLTSEESKFPSEAAPSPTATEEIHQSKPFSHEHDQKYQEEIKSLQPKEPSTSLRQSTSIPIEKKERSDFKADKTCSGCIVL